MTQWKWDDLHYFLALAETGTFKAAAARMGGVSKTTVSRHIDALESALGMKLFIRTADGAVLTDQGRRILDHARGIERSIATLWDRARTEGDYAGPIRLVTSDGMACHWLPPVLDAFEAMHPEIQISIDCNMDTSRFALSQFDIGILYEIPEDSELIRLKDATRRFALCASESYLNLYGRPTTWEDVRKNHRLLVCESYPTNGEWQLFAELADTGNVSLRVWSSMALYHASIMGRGICMHPVDLIERNKKLVALDFDYTASMTFTLACPRHTKDVPRVRALANYLKAQMFTAPYHAMSSFDGDTLTDADAVF